MHVEYWQHMPIANEVDQFHKGVGMIQFLCFKFGILRFVCEYFLDKKYETLKPSPWKVGNHVHTKLGSNNKWNFTEN
jgi:hypothetical protein